MILASHNSWSYARPKKWYLYPLRFMAQCQNQNIKLQFFSGVRMFDLRIYFAPSGVAQVRHGWMAFNISENQLFDDLMFLDSKTITSGDIYVRVILEQNKEEEEKIQEFQEERFKVFCSQLEKHFHNLSFIEGVRKFDWKHLYQFYNTTPVIIHKYSSTTSMFGNHKDKWYAKLDDFWPWLYASLHNADNYANYIDTNSYLMLDFI